MKNILTIFLEFRRDLKEMQEKTAEMEKKDRKENVVSQELEVHLVILYSEDLEKMGQLVHQEKRVTQEDQEYQVVLDCLEKKATLEEDVLIACLDHLE